MTRRLLATLAVLGTVGAGIAVPVLVSTSSTSAEPTSVCVRMPLQRPTDPYAAGYCLLIPSSVIS